MRASSGTAAGTGFACILSGAICGEFLGQLGTAGQGATSFDDSRVIYPRIDREVTIRKSANVTVYAEGGGGGAQMVIDPKVSLDQAAFDEAQGGAPLALALRMAGSRTV